MTDYRNDDSDFSGKQDSEDSYDTVHSISHEYQKSRIKNENVRRFSRGLKNSVSKSASEAHGAGRFIEKHKKAFLVIIAVSAIVLVFFALFSSCGITASVGLSAFGMSTYPSADEEMISAENLYTAWEQNLSDLIYSYEKEGEYDEYVYDLDELGHDPYVLISFVTAFYGHEWTLSEAESVMNEFFISQYELVKTVETETRYRYVTRTGIRYVISDETGETTAERYTYREKEYYEYTTCIISLRNNDLSFLPVYFLDHDGLSRYAVYMATLGNRPDLFPSSAYIERYTGNEDDAYSISDEAMSDERFKKMMEEALKYLGYPYVFGGSDPSTSFDCSGYVSWVINHSGWNVGRLGATALCNICTPVSETELKPGDLVFFKGTYRTNNPDACSHVGIYVGDGMMLHCGDPIGYTSLDTEYWQSHLYTYGRLPDP